MHTEECPFCCGAVVVGGFGGGESWNSERDEEGVRRLTSELKSILRTCRRSGTSLVYATTMSNQPNAAKVLERLGFYTSKPFDKVGPDNDDWLEDDDDKAPHTRKMQAWFLPLSEYKG